MVFLCLQVLSSMLNIPQEKVSFYLVYVCACVCVCVCSRVHVHLCVCACMCASTFSCEAWLTFCCRWIPLCTVQWQKQMRIKTASSTLKNSKRYTCIYMNLQILSFSFLRINFHEEFLWEWLAWPVFTISTPSEFLCQTNHCHIASKVRTLEPSRPGISLFNCRLLVSLWM